ncbi:MAG: ABC transporter permease [Chitinispirillaceae bacterium]
MKIAWRNIMRHKGKSFVIGSILFLGALLMTVGNGVISGMDKGLEEHIVNGFTGDLIIVSDEQESDNLFLDMMGKPIEPIYNYKQIDSLLNTLDHIDKYTPIGKNVAMVLNEEGGAPGYAYLLGVDLESYREMFPRNISLLQGNMLDSGNAGVLVPTGARKEMFSYTNLWFTCEDCPRDTSFMPPEAKEVKNSLIYKDNVVFMGMTTDNTSTDIRLGIKGIIEYSALNTIWGQFVTMDIESYRRCLGYFTSADKCAELDESEKELFSAENEDLDALFSSDMLTDESTGEAFDSDMRLEIEPEPETKNADLEAGAFNMVLVLLKDHGDLEKKVDLVDSALDSAGIEARAVDWKKATGSIGSMASLIKGSLFMFVMFLFFVAVIIIVNTLSMAALERTSEIGMMRAVGARKGFISSMFLGETALLSFFFGGLGILSGIVVIQILSFLNITTDNDMIQLLYGGDTFNPLITWGDLTLAIFQLAMVTLIAVIYPVRVARNITPLDAISRD